MTEEPLVPIVFVTMKNGAETVTLKALLDSGAGASLITSKHCDTLKTTIEKSSFNTVAGLILDYSMETITWDDASIPMKATPAQVSDSFHIKDPKGIDDMVKCTGIAGDI
eukprot:6082958-Ditylum_brightwellii.AAC.1